MNSVLQTFLIKESLKLENRSIFMIPFSAFMGKFFRIRYRKILPPFQTGLSVQSKISPKNSKVKFQRRKEIERWERELLSELG
jgi:hypothetical protein